MDLKAAFKNIGRGAAEFLAAAGGSVWDDSSAWTPTGGSLGGWFSNILTAQRTESGAVTTPESSMALAAYYAALHNKAEDIGKLPFLVYQREGRGKRRAIEHPIYKLLKYEPAPNMSPISWKETITHFGLGWGGGFAGIILDGAGRPIELPIIHPANVKIIRIKKSDLQQLNLSANYLGKVLYQISVQDEKPVGLWPESILHLHDLGSDGITGYAMSALAKESVGLGLEVEKFGARFFANGAAPGIVLIHPRNLTTEAVIKYRDKWNLNYQGASKAHKAALLTEGVKIEKLGVPPEEAQFLQTRAFQIEEIARWFRMPQHKIGKVDRIALSSIEAQNIEYVVDSLMPWAVRWEQEVNQKLFFPGERGEYFAEILFTALLRGDSTQRSIYYRTMFGIGAMTINDIREAENMNGIGDIGNLSFMPLNMVPATEDGVARMMQGGAAPGGPTGSTTENRPGQPGADQPDPEAERTATVRGMEPLIAAALDRLYRKETKATEAAKKKYEKPGAYAGWLEKFAAEEEALFVQAVGPILISLDNLTGGNYIERLNEYAALHGKYLRLSGTSLDLELKDYMENLLEVK